MYFFVILFVSISGRNIKIVVSDEVSKGNVRDWLEFVSVCFWFFLFFNFFLKFLVIMMLLLISMFNEIINVVNDMCLSIILENVIIEMVMSIILGIIFFIMSLVFMFKNSNIMVLIIVRVFNMLIFMLLMVFCIILVCRVIVVSCMFIGNIWFKLVSCVLICGLKVNIFIWLFFVIENIMIGLLLR